jgi:hypothetical protein
MKLISIIIFIIILSILYNYITSLYFTNNLDCKVLNLSLNNNDKYLEYLSYLDGYWISNSEFNKESDIDNMILYIDYNNNNGSLMIISNNTILSNDDIIFNIDYNKIKKYKNGLNKLDFICKFKTLKNNNKFIWNNLEFKCTLSIKKGNLKLFHNNILYADLNKDNLITNYINEN